MARGAGQYIFPLAIGVVCLGFGAVVWWNSGRSNNSRDQAIRDEVRRSVPVPLSDRDIEMPTIDLVEEGAADRLRYEAQVKIRRIPFQVWEAASSPILTPSGFAEVQVSGILSSAHDGPAPTSRPIWHAQEADILPGGSFGQRLGQPDAPVTPNDLFDLKLAKRKEASLSQQSLRPEELLPIFAARYWRQQGDFELARFALSKVAFDDQDRKVIDLLAESVQIEKSLIDKKQARQK